MMMMMMMMMMMSAWNSESKSEDIYIQILIFTIHFRLVTTLRMRGCTPPLPLTHLQSVVLTEARGYLYLHLAV
jgi:hypothetical protein